MKFITFLVRSKLWVAIAAAVMTYHAYSLFCSQILVITVLHVFFLTLAAYLFLVTDGFKHKKFMMYISTTGSILIFFVSPYHNWPVLAAGGFLVLTYQTEWLTQLGIRLPFEFRKIPVVKNLSIAASWVLLTTVIIMPQLVSVSAYFALYCTGNFLFILSLSIAEDIAHSGLDQMKTLVTRFGLRGARLVAIVVMVMATMCYALSLDLNVASFGNMLSVLAGMVLLFRMMPGGNMDIKGFLIDGIIVLSGISLLY